MKVYTGVGSRNTPQNILDFMSEIAISLEKNGWILRSGAAEGADIAFEKNIIKLKEIYLPWKGYNSSKSKLYNISDKAFEIAEENYSSWKYLKDGHKKIIAYNVHQVLGTTLNVNSKFLICWTPDGCESHTTRTTKTGGTGIAISVASKLNIPIFNLANEDSYKRVKKLLLS